jgi:hypothetical protein
MTILEALRAIKAGNRAIGDGICWALERLVPGRAGHEFLDKAFADMDLDMSYPVPATEDQEQTFLEDDEPECGTANEYAFVRCLDMWSGEYGENRLALLDLLIKRAEEECE